MPTIIRIQDIAFHVGQEVTLQGWLYDKTGKGKLQFLQVRDGTGIVQAVVFKKDVAPEVFEAAQAITQESSMLVSGVVRADARAPGIPGGFELGVQDMRVVQLAGEYPIGPKEHGVDFLMDHRHLWLRSKRQWAVLRVRASVIKAIRAWLDGNGFLGMDTPILTPAACEGTSTLFETDYFGDPAFLTQSGQLYNEATIAAFGKTYCFGPTFRAEKSKTRRHLTEFWMVEPEVAYCDLNGIMEIEEQFVSAVVQTVLQERAAELAALERDLAPLHKVTPPFPRISYDDALDLLRQVREKTDDPEQKQLLELEWGSDLGSPHETAIAAHFDKPVFVHHYPSQCKAFYMEPTAGRGEVCESVDLLAPEGYGEIIGGGQRMSRAEDLDKAIEKHRLPREAYGWYIDLRLYGSTPHSGFGLGIERTVAWLCGLEHIRETIPFPRTLSRMYP
ncbi:MAG: asparagine--tRNA ligase [Thermoflexales bacterium]|nr:asparagine--tRNA ligase [Thermoflexales bacterium]